jgi:hypothetical protein
MFGTAEADFQTHILDFAEQRAQIGGRRLRQIERDARQSRIEQRLLPRLQGMPLAPAKEGALRC